jgi:AraC-like DNA-binding protein
MRAQRSSSPWQSDEDPGRFTIDIAVPYAAPNRNDILRTEWQRQGGEFLPVPTLTLPRRSEGFCAVRIRLKQMADLLIEDMYSDAVAGRCHWEDRIKIVIQLQGEARFTVARRDIAMGAGMVCASRNEATWDWEVGRSARAIVLVLPACDVRFPRNQRSITADQSTPAARLLLAHLQSWAGLRDEPSPAVAWASRNATLELLHGLLNDQVVDDEQFSSALVKAAMDCIESRLLADPDLNPRTIAVSLHVSTRTLHRAFTNEATSVMGYVRERRLDRARSDLMTTSLTMSEIANRWHFTDSSHFIKAYKKRFDELPAALQRNRHTAHGLSGWDS